MARMHEASSSAWDTCVGCCFMLCCDGGKDYRWMADASREPTSIHKAHMCARTSIRSISAMVRCTQPFNEASPILMAVVTRD